MTKPAIRLATQRRRTQPQENRNPTSPGLGPTTTEVRREDRAVNKKLTSSCSSFTGLHLLGPCVHKERLFLVESALAIRALDTDQTPDHGCGELFSASAPPGNVTTPAHITANPPLCRSIIKHPLTTACGKMPHDNKHTSSRSPPSAVATA